MPERISRTSTQEHLKRKPSPAEPAQAEENEALNLKTGISTNQVVGLQQTIGNRAVQRLLSKVPLKSRTVSRQPAAGMISRLAEAPAGLISRTGSAPGMEDEEVARMVEAPAGLISRTGSAPGMEDEEI